ncbi:MAG: GFA family protein [Steroidobacteraceae bacterium]
MVESSTHDGSCLCGTVRYQVTGPFHTMMSCHCSMCRKHHGAPFGTYVSSKMDGFRWLAGEDSILAYESSGQGKRYSCKVCGSVLPMMMPEHGLAVCPSGPLEGDLGITPKAHLFVGSKAPWYTITDSLPQHEEYPPEYSAQGIPRPQVEAKPGVTPGSCLCGDVAFEVTGDALFMWNCHCQRCRRARSAAHNTNIFYRPAQFRWTRGESQVVDYKLPEARFYGVAFCKRCGGSVPRASIERGIVVVPAGCLDADPGARPNGHIYTNHKASWFEITDSVPQHPEAPPPPPEPRPS